MTAFPRVIPVLLVSGGYLVKPVGFKGEKYIGDPINAIRIFNEKQVDELIICDIDATPKRTGINYRLIEDIASEAFMPIGYGGGVATREEARRIIDIGIEKVVLGSTAHTSPGRIEEISDALGSSSTAVSVDARKRLRGGWQTATHRGTKKVGLSPADAAVRAQQHGAGEILVSSIDREGTFGGYDLPLISSVASSVDIPVIALGGASNPSDFSSALNAGASAVAAGSMFVLHGKHRAVLISYPDPETIRGLARPDTRV